MIIQQGVLVHREMRERTQELLLPYHQTLLEELCRIQQENDCTLRTASTRGQVNVRAKQMLTFKCSVWSARRYYTVGKDE